MDINSPPAGATARLADYVFATGSADLPEAVRREALRSFVNVMGCMFGGARHEVVDLADRALEEFAGAANTTLVGRGRKSGALHACLVNCLASGIHGFDDTHAQAVIHPSGPVAAAVLAVSERTPVDGRDFLLAFALGVEIACRLSKSISVPPARGNIAWSQTGIGCGVGAAVAAGKLLGLDARQLRWAMGTAVAQAAGLRVMHGSMASSLMSAHAAQTGLRAAILAQQGFTSSEVSLEGRYGYLDTFATEPDMDALEGGLGERFEILRNTYKPYPCGIVIHPIIDACLQLRAEHAPAPDDIVRVSIDASPNAIALTDRRNPKDELQAHVSLHHWVAICFLRGTTRVEDMDTETAVRDPSIVAFQDKVHATGNPAIAQDAADMTLTLANGTALRCRIDHCRGSAARPMTDAELERKFMDLAEDVIGAGRARAVLDMCWQVETLPDVARLPGAAA